jgi:hypothetical protein
MKWRTEMSQATRVLNALKDGQEMTAKQITARFGAKNPRAVIQNIRFEGFPVYLNKRTNSKGDVKGFYRLGTPSKAVIAAGYKAMAAGLV